jgi:hypothetical protein
MNALTNVHLANISLGVTSVSCTRLVRAVTLNTLDFQILKTCHDLVHGPLEVVFTRIYIENLNSKSFKRWIVIWKWCSASA